jgi:hypothetical protein
VVYNNSKSVIFDFNAICSFDRKRDCFDFVALIFDGITLLLADPKPSPALLLDLAESSEPHSKLCDSKLTFFMTIAESFLCVEEMDFLESAVLFRSSDSEPAGLFRACDSESAGLFRAFDSESVGTFLCM